MDPPGWNEQLSPSRSRPLQTPRRASIAAGIMDFHDASARAAAASAQNLFADLASPLLAQPSVLSAPSPTLNVRLSHALSASVSRPLLRQELASPATRRRASIPALLSIRSPQPAAQQQPLVRHSSIPTLPRPASAAPSAPAPPSAAPACEPQSEPFVDLLRRAEQEGHQPLIIRPPNRRPALPRHDSLELEMTQQTCSAPSVEKQSAADADSSAIFDAAAVAAAVDDEETEGLLTAEQAPYDLLESSIIEDLHAVTRPAFLSSSSSSASLSSFDNSPQTSSPITSPSIGKLRSNMSKMLSTPTTTAHATPLSTAPSHFAMSAAAASASTPLKHAFSLSEEYTSPLGSVVINLGSPTPTSSAETNSGSLASIAAAADHAQSVAPISVSTLASDMAATPRLPRSITGDINKMKESADADGNISISFDRNRSLSMDASSAAQSLVTPVKTNAAASSLQNSQPPTQRRALSLAFAQAAVNAARNRTPTHQSTHQQQQQLHQQSFESISEFDPLAKSASKHRQSIAVTSQDWMMQFDSPLASANAPRSMLPDPNAPSVSTPIHSGTAAGGGMAAAAGSYSMQPQSLLDVVDPIATPGSILKYTQRDMDALARRLQQSFEKEFELAQLEIQELTLRAENTRLESQRMKDTLVQWESSVKHMISEKDKERIKWQQERTQLQDQITALETDCDASKRETEELSIKYKQLRLDMSDLRDVESKQRVRITELEESLKVSEQRFDSLRKHAESKLDEANVEIARVKSTYEKETSALRARSTQMEVKIQTLEQSLQAKTKESADLTALCDELVAQMEQMAKT